MRLSFLRTVAWRLLPLALVLLAGHFAVAPARAHEIRPTIATLELDASGGFTLALSVNLEALVAAIGPDHQDSTTSPNARDYARLRALPPEALGEAYRSFEADFRAGIALSDDRGADIPLRQDRVEIAPVGDVSVQRTSLVIFSGRVPERSQSVVWRFDAGFGPSVIRARPAGGDIFFSEYLTDGAPSKAIGLGSVVRQSRLSVFANYVAIGFEHIVPKGLDHILFVVGLFLLSPRLKPVLWQVTWFTLAHSATLALGMTGLVRIPPSVVEPLIALSIVYVAVENLRGDRLGRWRPLVVFLFGLLHGLGFAGVLAEIGLAPGDFLVGLVAFNLGVELGQLAVVAGCFLAVGVWFGDRAWYRRAVAMPASLAIAAIGAWWFVERVT